MEAASVSELKAHLSKYLRMVRRGGEVQILDHGRPVARLTGIATTPAGADDAHREALIRSGLIRPRRRDPMGLLDEPPLELPVDLRHTVAEERTDRA